MSSHGHDAVRVRFATVGVSSNGHGKIVLLYPLGREKGAWRDVVALLGGGSVLCLSPAGLTRLIVALHVLSSLPHHAFFPKAFLSKVWPWTLYSTRDFSLSTSLHDDRGVSSQRPCLIPTVSFKVCVNRVLDTQVGRHSLRSK